VTEYVSRLVDLFATHTADVELRSLKILRWQDDDPSSEACFDLADFISLFVKEEGPCVDWNFCNNGFGIFFKCFLFQYSKEA
jgi:hypothetical protein